MAGWLAGKLVKGESFGFIGNLVIGIVGSVLGGALFSRFGVSAGGGWLGSLLVATVAQSQGLAPRKGRAYRELFVLVRTQLGGPDDADGNEVPQEDGDV